MDLKKKSDLHLSRKFVHMGFGSLLLLLAVFIAPSYKAAGEFIFGFSVVAFISELLRLKFPSMNQATLKSFGFMMRDYELKKVTAFPQYLFGFAFCFYFVKPPLAIMAICFLIFSDPISSIVGIKYGRHKIMAGKSLEGAAGGLATCLIISIITIFCSGVEVEAPKVLMFSISAALIGVLSEVLPTRIDDNLSIPLFSGIGLSILNSIFHIF